MKRILLPLILAASAVGVQAVTTVATGVYDEQAVQSNAVDVNRSGAAQFQAALDTAFSAGRGGVANFDDLATGLHGATLGVSFAAGAKTLNITDGGSSTGFDVGVGGSRTPISGANLLNATDSLHPDGVKNDWVFHFNSITGGELGEGVVRVGFTILGRAGTDRVIEKIVVTFDDNSSASVLNINYAGQGTADTFASFTAPTGRTIRKLVIENTGVDFTSIDDLAFITATFPPVLPALTPYTGSYRDAVERYADAMMAHGRDTYGSGNMPSGDPKRSGLFLSALDRTNPSGPAILSSSIPARPQGTREHDRVIHLHRDDPNRRLYGSDLGDNQPFLAMLYELSALKDVATYRDAADGNLRWIFRNTRSGQNGAVATPTDLLAWGEHTSWDVVNDRAATGYFTGEMVHEFTERFELWEKVYAQTPADAEAYASGLWNWQINDKTTGDFDRHANYDGQFGFRDEFDFPRHGGYYIQTWAAAIRDTTDTDTDAFFRHAIEVVLSRFEDKKAAALAAYGAGHDLIQLSDNPRDADKWVASQTLDLTQSAHIAAATIDPTLADPLSQRLIAFARAEDETFLSFAHDPAGAGFVTDVTISTLAETGRSGDWGLAYGAGSLTHRYGAFTANRAKLLEGSTNATDQAHRQQFIALTLAAADFYLVSDPDLDKDGDYGDERVWAIELSAAIDLLLEAHVLSGNDDYLRRARYFGDIAVNVFWGAYDLPRASTDTAHYEALTGAGNLGLSLLHLHSALLTRFLPDRRLRIEKNGVGYRLSLPTVPGARYRLSESTTLNGWTSIEEKGADGITLEFTVAPSASAERRFYRVGAVENIP